MGAEFDWDEVSLDERYWTSVIADHAGLDVLTVDSLVRWCEKELAGHGITGVKSVEQRWNERGEAIGPDVRISFRFEMLLSSVAIKLAEARRAAFDDALEGWPT